MSKSQISTRTKSCRSRKGAWIEIFLFLYTGYAGMVAPVRERGLKYYLPFWMAAMRPVAPVRERGLKLLSLHQYSQTAAVAPARERGLKWLLRAKQGKMRRRSREGAWIEIRNMVGFSVLLTQITHSD